MLKRIKQRKQRKSQIIMGGVLVFLMLFGMMGIFTYNNSSADYEYNGFEFTWDGRMYYTEIEGKEMSFYTLPPQLVDINVTPTFKNKIRSRGMYITFNPNQESNNLIFIDVVRNDLTKNIQSYVISTITEPSDTYDLPIITCENATSTIPVIYINVGNETSVKQEGECLILNGKQSDLLRIRDLIIYTFYGVIDE